MVLLIHTVERKGSEVNQQLRLALPLETLYPKATTTRRPAAVQPPTREAAIADLQRRLNISLKEAADLYEELQAKSGKAVK